MEGRFNRIDLMRPARDSENQNPGKDLGDSEQWGGVGKRLTYWTIGGVVLDGNWIAVYRLARAFREFSARNLFNLRCGWTEVRTRMDVSLDDEKLYCQRKESNRKQQRIGRQATRTGVASPSKIQAPVVAIFAHPRSIVRNKAG